jgi:hypothetical protein
MLTNDNNSSTPGRGGIANASLRPALATKQGPISKQNKNNNQKYVLL